MDLKVANWIALTVTAVWAVSFVADILLKTYSPPAGINIVMLTVVGGIFGYRLVRGNGSNGTS